MDRFASNDEIATPIADDKRLSPVIGQIGEAFYESAYPRVMGLRSNGKAVIIEGETQDGLVRGYSS